MAADGFFISEEMQSTGPAIKRASGCGACQLHKHCRTPKMKPWGKGERGILIIGDSPSTADDKNDMAFMGDAGQFLRRKLKWQGIDLDRDCRSTYAIHCYSKDTPTERQIEACRSRVWQEIEAFRPQLILLLGTQALQSFLSHRKRGLGSITKWRGWAIPDRDADAWVVPMFHPQEVLWASEKNPAVERVFELDLIKAMSMLDKPLYRPMVRESAGVEIITDPKELNDRLHAVNEMEGLLAYDYETTGLKCQRDGHEIVTCAFATTEEHAVAFNMPKPGTKGRRLWKNILENNNIKKIAHNIKFEDTWSALHVPAKVQNWFWDTMLAAHVMDNREGVTGLKFQAYVQFGVIDYSSHIDSYLSSDEDAGGNGINKIHKAPRKEILIYNGVDAMLEYRLAIKQMKELGVDYVFS